MGEVRPDEGLWRSVFSGTQANRARRGTGNRTVAKAFQERDGVTELSVDRYDGLDLREGVRKGDRDAVGRSASGFYGWLVVPASAAEANGRRVVPSPTEENPYHADIVLAFTDRFGPKDHALALATASRWHERPSL